jgi:hypothetical protein
MKLFAQYYGRGSTWLILLAPILPKIFDTYCQYRRLSDDTRPARSSNMAENHQMSDKDEQKNRPFCRLAP